MSIDLRNCVTLYDFDRALPWDIKGWYYASLDWFARHDQIITRAGFGTKNGKSSRSTVSFKTCDKKLRLIDFHEVTGIDLYAKTSKQGFDMYAPFATVLMCSNFRPKLTIYYPEAVVPFAIDYVIDLVKTMSYYMPTLYGIFYQLGSDQGYLGYAAGACSVGETSEEEDIKRTKWFNFHESKKYYKIGILRDIYILNFISQAHLEWHVHGQTLKSWIESDPLHGTLKPITNTLWCWHVLKENIPLVYDRLKDTGIILCTLDEKLPPIINEVDVSPPKLNKNTNHAETIMKILGYER